MNTYIIFQVKRDFLSKDDYYENNLSFASLVCNQLRDRHTSQRDNIFSDKADIRDMAYQKFTFSVTGTDDLVQAFPLEDHPR